MEYQGYYGEENKKQIKADIYMEKKQRNTMQKGERKKKVMMKECSTYRKDFDQKEGEREIIQNRNPLD